MDAAFLGLLVIIVVALAFDYTNGFHDAANAIAVAVSTKALTPRVALALAAVMNLVGALISTKVAATVGAGIIDAPTGTDGLVVVFAALIGAIAWNLITWYFGLPSSSSHALIGGLVGAALAASQSVQWLGVLDKVVIPMVLSPLIGFGLATCSCSRSCGRFRRAQRAPGEPRLPVRADRLGRAWPSATAPRTRRRRWASSPWRWSPRESSTPSTCRSG